MSHTDATDPTVSISQPQAPALAALALLAALSVGCSSSGEPTAATGGSAGTGGTTVTAGAGGAGGATGAGGTTGNAALGGFTITIVAEAPATATAAATAAHTTLIGKIYDGAYPAGTLWTLVESAGGCDLLTPKVPYCSTPCASGQVCVEDGKCGSYPTSQNVGTVTVTGMGADFTMAAGPSNTYQPDTSVTLAYPPCAEGSAMTIAAIGGTLAPFTLNGTCIAPLDLPAGTYALATGSPLALTWTAPGATSTSRIRVHLDISHHGGSKGKIECDVQDTGSLSIPASLVTKLVGLGVAGYPTITVSRAFWSEATIAAGRVALTITAPVERAVTVPGVESCTADTECTAPKTCQDDLTCG
jgi:hypothetical protein